MEAVLYAIGLQVLAGTAALFLGKWPRAATIVGAGGAVLGCLLGVARDSGCPSGRFSASPCAWLGMPPTGPSG